jgi:hypothetical protein
MCFAATAVTITAPAALAITSISSNSPICSGNILNLFQLLLVELVKSYNWSEMVLYLLHKTLQLAMFRQLLQEATC